MFRLTTAALFLFAAIARAQMPLVLDVWPGGKAVDDAGIAGEERFFELKVNGKPYQVGGKPTKWLTNVSRPTISVYRPAKDKDTGAAMIICPGGGYHNLGWDVEGEEVAAWLNSVGITGILLKYRCPRRPGDTLGVPAAGPLKDAQRALSLVRSKAKEWGIDPNRLGMVGFSAGGHLVGATATNFDKRSYAPVDAVDEFSCRPDFGVMLYSGYLHVKGKDEVSADLRVSDKTPPLMLVHASDDAISTVDNSIIMYLALKRASAKAELHVYATGGHGFAVRDVGLPCTEWTRSCLAWLNNLEMLKAK